MSRTVSILAKTLLTKSELTWRAEKTIAILPNPGADEECDAADAEVERIEEELNEILEEVKKTLKYATRNDQQRLLLIRKQVQGSSILA